MGVPHGLPEYLKNVSPPPLFEPRTFQPAASPSPLKNHLVCVFDVQAGISNQILFLLYAKNSTSTFRPFQRIILGLPKGAFTLFSGETLSYKPEGHGFISQRCHWEF